MFAVFNFPLPFPFYSIIKWDRQMVSNSDKQMIIRSGWQKIIKWDRQMVINSDEQMIIKSDRQMIIKPDRHMILKSDRQVITKSDRQMEAPRSLVAWLSIADCCSVALLALRIGSKPPWCTPMPRDSISFRASTCCNIIEIHQIPLNYIIRTLTQIVMSPPSRAMSHEPYAITSTKESGREIRTPADGRWFMVDCHDCQDQYQARSSGL